MQTLDMLIEESTNTKERLLYSGLKFFSEKGYSNVGIRQLCTSVGIKESSFYNHFKSKEKLFIEIMNLMVVEGDKVLLSDEEMCLFVEKMSVEDFMKENLRMVQNIFSNPIFIAIMRLVVMESFINPLAYDLSENNSYKDIRNNTIMILHQYKEKGEIKICDIPVFVDTYYHALNSYNSTYILNDAWGKKQEKVLEDLGTFNQFYINILKGELYEK